MVILLELLRHERMVRYSFPPANQVKISGEEAREGLLDGSIADVTVNGYKGKIRVIERFCDGATLTMMLFYQFLWVASEQGMNPGTAQGYRCAVLHAQRRGRFRALDGTCWAAEEELKKACRGVGSTHGFAKGSPRGAITAAMLLHAIDANAAAGTPVAIMDQWYMWLIYEGALRRDEFVTLRTGGITADERGLRIQLWVDKRAKKGSNFPQIHPRVVSEQFVRLYTQMSFGLHPTDDRILRQHPSATMTRLNNILQRSATLCAWPTGLKFDGIHCLRHGHAVDYRFDPILRERMSCSQQNADYYGRLNADRIKGLKRLDLEAE
jgi:hypothetical protein